MTTHAPQASHPASKPKGNALKLILKFLLVGGLFYFLSKKGLLSLEATKAAFARWDLMIPIFLSFTIANLIGITRWHVLLGAQKIHLPLVRTLQLGYVGGFFNIALPGAVSGDVVKAVYVAKEAPGKRAFAFSSILFDRVVGVSALVLVSAGGWLLTLINPVESENAALWSAVELTVGTAGAGALMFYVYLFLVDERRDLILKIFRGLEAKAGKLGSLTRIYEGIRNYAQHKGSVMLALVMSIAIHLIVVFAFRLCAEALGEAAIPTLAFYVVIPLGLLVTAVPVLPAGMGTGHAAFLALFHLLGSERGVALFNLYLVFVLIQGAIGGVVYLFFRSHLPHHTSHTNQAQISQ